MKEVLKGVRVTRGSGFEIKRQDGGLVTVEWRSGRSSAHLGDSVLVGTGDRSDYFKVAGLYHELIHEQLHTGAGDEELLAEWKTFQSNVAGNLDMRALAQDIASSFEYDLAGRASRSREDKARVVEDVERWLVHEVFTYEKEAAVKLAGQSLLRWHGKGDAQSAARKDVQALLRRVGVDRSRDTSFSLSGRTEKRIAQAVERVSAAGKGSPLPDMGTVLPVSERVRMQPQRSTYIRAKGEG